MKLFGSNKVEKKENPTGKAIFLQNQYKTKNRNDLIYAQEGYGQNVIVYRCIREITTALGQVEIEVQSAKDSAPIETHPALDLLRKPNPTESWSQFIRHAFTDYLISGNMFVTKDKAGNSIPIELWAQSPLFMEVKAGRGGMPAFYKYKTAQDEVVFTVDQITGQSQCFHLKTYNPENPFLGLSPMSHSALAADVHNSGLKWNSSLLENGARPSGMVKFPDTPTNDVIGQLKEYFKKTVQGKNNAGELPVLTGGADFIEMQVTAKEMDYMKLMQECAKYVASAYGVPLPLIDNDASTFNNLEQAKERLWTDTVLPLLNEFLEAFGNWLLPAYGKDLKFGYNIDSIPALESLRTKRFTRMADGIGKGMLTINEAREANGYEEIEGGDELLIPSNLVPMGIDSGTDEEDAALKTLGYSAEEIKAIRAEASIGKAK